MKTHETFHSRNLVSGQRQCLSISAQTEFCRDAYVNLSLNYRVIITFFFHDLIILFADENFVLSIKEKKGISRFVHIISAFGVIIIVKSLLPRLFTFNSLFDITFQ